MSLKSLQIRILRNWEFFVIIGLPLLLLPLLFLPDDEVIGVAPNTRPSSKFKCAFVLILMAIYWMVEAMPLAITALLPMVLFPLLGVQDTAKVSINYMKETNMMFVGGLIIAMAVEYCNLHRRIALTVMTTVGVSPIRLMCGIMLTTSFLSMWMSNTATAAMVCPIAMAVLEELFPKHDETPHGFRKRRASIFKERSEVDFEAFVEKIKKKRAILKHQQSLPAEQFYSEARRAQAPARKTMKKQLSFRIDPEPLEPSELTRFIRERDKQKDLQFEMSMEEHENENDEDVHVELANGGGIVVVEPEVPKPEDLILKRRLNLKKMLLFSILLSSNIGGTGVITGTASNLVFQELIKPVNVGQGGKYVDISFATWMAYNIPPMIVNIAFSFIYLVIMYLGVPDWVYFWRKKSTSNEVSEETEALNRVARVLNEKRRLLGKVSFHESAVFALFLIIVALWLFREPKFMKGWAEHLSEADIGDSTPALFVVILLFIIPRNMETFCGVSDNNGGAVLTKTPPLLDWKYVQLNLPWGVILLMGGGFALSNAVVYSGLSDWLGRQLNAVETLPLTVILVVVMFLTATLTEVASNSACVNVVIPILIALSESLNIHPLYLTLPATVTCSYAFLLPVATPTNAIVFAAGGGDINIMEMVKVCLFPNFVCILVILFFHVTYGNLIFNFGDYVYPAGSLYKTTTTSTLAPFIFNATMAMGSEGLLS